MLDLPEGFTDDGGLSEAGLLQLFAAAEGGSIPEAEEARRWQHKGRKR
jgi:hypothetical protein